MRVLDMEAERGAVRVYGERPLSFTEKAMEEAGESTDDDKQHLFMTVYSESCTTWRTTAPDNITRLSLVGQSYVCSRPQKRLIQSSALMVFYQKNGNFVPLYELHHLQTKKYYLFLDKKALTHKLQEVFDIVKLTLGQLHTGNFTGIAWKAQTEKGSFYILWHNGCIIPSQDYLLFEEKKFEELKSTYALLRFTRSQSSVSDLYTVLCC